MEDIQFKGANGMVFMLQDGPMLILQVINSLLIGTNWSSVMIISPIFSAMALMNRVLSLSKANSYFRSAPCCALIFCVLPMLIFTLCIFDYHD